MHDILNIILVILLLNIIITKFQTNQQNNGSKKNQLCTKFITLLQLE